MRPATKVPGLVPKGEASPTASSRNRKLSPEHLEQVLTRISSEEDKTKVREANLGRKNSEESIAKMKNRVITDEVRAKIIQNITKYNLSKAHQVEVIRACAV